MTYEIKPQLSLENIFNRISSYHLFKFYCNNFISIGNNFPSEFRQDKMPSCSINFIGGDLLYKDFGTGESHRAISYVMAKYHISFLQALEKINRDFNLDLMSTVELPSTISVQNAEDVTKIKVPTMVEKSSTILRIKRREFTQKDYSYWNRFGWTKKMLILADIYPISHYWIKNHKGNRKFIVGSSMAFSFDYYWNEGTFRRKLYFPGVGNKRSVFISNVDNTIVQGVKLLPKTGGDILFITSSLKDCGTFWRIGYFAVAPNNEGSFLPEAYYKKALKRWKHIIIWYDNDWDKNDNPGVTCAKKYAQQHGLSYYHTPNGEPKDPSDYVAKYGLEKFNLLVNKHLQEDGKI